MFDERVQLLRQMEKVSRHTSYYLFGAALIIFGIFVVGYITEKIPVPIQIILLVAIALFTAFGVEFSMRARMCMIHSELLEMIQKEAAFNRIFSFDALDKDL